MQTFSTSQHLIQSLIDTQLKKNVHIIMIFEKVFKTNNMFMLQRPVNLYFW